MDARSCSCSLPNNALAIHCTGTLPNNSTCTHRTQKPVRLRSLCSLYFIRLKVRYQTLFMPAKVVFAAGIVIAIVADRRECIPLFARRRSMGGGSGGGHSDRLTDIKRNLLVAGFLPTVCTAHTHTRTHNTIYGCFMPHSTCLRWYELTSPTIIMIDH